MHKNLKQHINVNETKINKSKRRNRSTIIVGDFNIPLLMIDRTARPNNPYKFKENFE